MSTRPTNRPIVPPARGTIDPEDTRSMHGGPTDPILICDACGGNGNSIYCHALFHDAERLFPPSHCNRTAQRVCQVCGPIIDTGGQEDRCISCFPLTHAELVGIRLERDARDYRFTPRGDE